MKEHVFRLHRGDDLRKSLEQYARKHDIGAAVLLSCVGCVSEARLRDASGVNIRSIDEHCEIVSATGTVSSARTHVHVSLANEQLTTFGGHLAEGCIINTTAEIVLLELDSCRFGSAFDPETGYQELEIISLDPHPADQSL